MLSDAYQISDEMKLEEIPITYKIFAATSGNLSVTARLIGDAYMLSKMEEKPINLNLFADVMRCYGVDDSVNPFLLPLDRLELRELIVHSDWHFGYRANKNSIVDAEYIVYGISSNKRLYTIDGAA